MQFWTKGNEMPAQPGPADPLLSAALSCVVVATSSERARRHGYGLGVVIGELGGVYLDRTQQTAGGLEYGRCCCVVVLLSFTEEEEDGRQMGWEWRMS